MKPTIGVLIVGLAVVGTLVALCGCETQSATEAEIVVTPASAELAVGESAEFTASGWDGYRWDLSDDKIGVLSRRTGSTVRYTNISSASSNSVQTITVTGLGTGGSSSTNGTSFFVTGQAVVRHI